MFPDEFSPTANIKSKDDLEELRLKSACWSSPGQIPWRFSLWKVSRVNEQIVWNTSECCQVMCWQLRLTVIAHHWSFWPVPFSPPSLAATPTPDTRSLGGLPVPFLEDSLNIHYNFSDRTLTVSLNLVIRFFFFFFFLIRSFTLHAVLKSYSWTSCTFPVGHLDLLQTIAYVEATFEASDFRHDRSHWSGCLGFVSSFVHLLFGLQYLFSVFQKSFVYILPLCVIWRGNFLLFVHLLLGLHSSGIGCKTFFFWWFLLIFILDWGKYG